MSHPKPALADSAASKRAKLDSTSATPAAAAAAAFVCPADWPTAGPINLATADLPHDSADTEWWYVNGHVVDPATNHDLSFFASFFKIVRAKKADGSLSAPHSNALTVAAADGATAPQPASARRSYHARSNSNRSCPLCSYMCVCVCVAALSTHAYALNWAIVDVTAGTYHADPVLDAATPEILKKQLADGTYDLDSRMNRAFMEVVNKGNVPLPDRMFEGPVTCAKDSLNLRYDTATFTKNAAGQYLVHCDCAAKGIALTLELTPQQKPFRQAHDGVVKIGLKQDTMFYYYIPRNKCTGTIQVNGKVHNVVGEAWYDHEFGGEIKASKTQGGATNGAAAVAASSSSSSAAAAAPAASNGAHSVPSHGDSIMLVAPEDKSKATYAWNWLSCQLDNGSEITATNLVDTYSKTVEDNFAIVTSGTDTRVEYLEMELKALTSWTSIRTTNDYPTHWRLTVPAAGIDLDVKSVIDNQEMITLISKPGFWEGRVNISGTVRGVAVKGKGFVERHGFTTMNSLDHFFKRISKQVMEQIDMVMPLKPNYAQTRELMASQEFDHFMDGVSIEVFQKTIVTPLREIIDRGGKSWRSFAFLLCIDAVGGNSPKYKHWLAMPEMMHVGSLIVDDIQDKSEIRRGGPACHIMHGDAIAINAGTAAYFLSLHILQSLTPDLDVTTRCRLYEIYFLTLRAGHAGQAFDIYGLDYLMAEAVKNGGNGPNGAALLEKSVLCTHRLKSAVPAGCLARMGALVGGGSHTQIEALGMYMESIGIAFQIIDDVLNLKGFEGNVKDRGEDIKAGKVTFPVAKAMARLDLAARTKVWETIQSKPQDIATVSSVIDQLDACGAIQASIDQANDLVTKAWAQVDAAIPDSLYKMLLRAFGWYVLERHY